jgi:hypothetical protein
VRRNSLTWACSSLASIDIMLRNRIFS